MDKETGSLWFPRDGALTGIAGHYADSALPELLIMEQTQWRAWRQRHPGGKFVTR